MSATYDELELPLRAYVGQLEADIRVRNDTIAELTQQIADLQPPPPPMRVGISVKDQAQYDGRTADFGVAPEIVRIFFPGLPGKLPTLARGTGTVVSFKPPSNDVQGFIDGKYDAPVSAWLTTYSGVVAVYHEREDNIERREFTLEQASRMDAHMAGLVKLYGRSRFGIILMEWTLNPKSGRAVEDYVDPTLYQWIGYDSYPADSATQDLPGLVWTQESFTRCRDNSFGLPWFICETGTRNKQNAPAAEYDARQAEWITRASALAETLGCRGFMYFDSTVGGDFTLKGPLALSAMGEAIRA
jgi:hypothetical protein